MSPWRVLVIDDSPTIHKVIEHALKRTGMQLVHARDGKSGISMARELKPDLILLDLVMPGMSGEEVADRLAIEPETTNIPLVFFTSLADTKEPDDDSLVEQRHFLQKNLPPKLLLRKLRDLLSDE